MPRQGGRKRSSEAIARRKKKKQENSMERRRNSSSGHSSSVSGNSSPVSQSIVHNIASDEDKLKFSGHSPNSVQWSSPKKGHEHGGHGHEGHGHEGHGHEGHGHEGHRNEGQRGENHGDKSSHHSGSDTSTPRSSSSSVSSHGNYFGHVQTLVIHQHNGQPGQHPNETNLSGQNGEQSQNEQRQERRQNPQNQRGQQRQPNPQNKGGRGNPRKQKGPQNPRNKDGGGEQREHSQNQGKPQDHPQGSSHDPNHDIHPTDNGRKKGFFANVGDSLDRGMDYIEENHRKTQERWERLWNQPIPRAASMGSEYAGRRGNQVVNGTVYTGGAALGGAGMIISGVGRGATGQVQGVRDGMSASVGLAQSGGGRGQGSNTFNLPGSSSFYNDGTGSVNSRGNNESDDDDMSAVAGNRYSQDRSGRIVDVNGSSYGYF